MMSTGVGWLPPSLMMHPCHALCALFLSPGFLYTTAHLSGTLIRFIVTLAFTGFFLNLSPLVLILSINIDVFRPLSRCTSLCSTVTIAVNSEQYLYWSGLRLNISANGSSSSLCGSNKGMVALLNSGASINAHSTVLNNLGLQIFLRSANQSISGKVFYEVYKPSKTLL